MAITTLSFMLFILATLILYYLVPKRLQWIVLLLASILFYLISSLKGAVYVLATAGTVYLATQYMQSVSDKQKAYFKENKETLSKEERVEIKTKNVKVRKSVMIAALLLNFGIMCVIKYSHFAVGTVNSLFHTEFSNNFSLIVPLGLSFYTFQSMGYLINVYWEKYRPEKNFLKVLLFVSFFPQMTQGPISEFDQFSKELFSEHEFTHKNFSWGFQRMLWGFSKKMLIADVLSPWVQNVFLNYISYSSLTVLIGAFLYSIQIYADFSGYMDIMCGYCEMLGIRLAENFEHPYFSKSIAEYWRRWHITLGAWFKNYIYYPIGISKWNRNLGKKLTAKFGKSLGRNLPATLALIAVWLTTGLWHGASWAYVAWGGVNGFFIIFSMWMEPVYGKMRSALHFSEDKWLWRAFQTIRTFVLVTFIKVLPEVGTLSEGFGLWKRIFSFTAIPGSIFQLFPFLDTGMITNLINMALAAGFTFLLFIISLIDRKHDFREDFNRAPILLRVTGLAVVLVILLSFGIQATWGTEGFLYAKF